MTFSVRTNVASLNAQTNLARTNRSLSMNFAKLSSGRRINRAADDAAGLAISTNLTADVRSAEQAKRNANDGIALIQTAEGGMAEISGILTRMRELAMQASSDTVGDAERTLSQVEFAAQIAEIDRITAVTEFNGTALLDGTASALDFQVGVNNTADDRITLNVAAMDSTTLGVNALDISTKAGAQASLATIDTGIGLVATERADMGAVQNRMDGTIRNLENFVANISDANSRILDVDVASETAALTRNQVLSQAGIAMLAQANAQPQSALSLIGG